MCLAVPGRIVATRDADGVRMADVDFGGIRKDVCLQFLPEVKVDDYVMVHVGFAIQRLDERSALDTLERFAALGILDEELGGPADSP